jgi:hypothetical protein
LNISFNIRKLDALDKTVQQIFSTKTQVFFELYARPYRYMPDA